MTDWSAVYERYRPSILAFLAQRLSNREEAEDLCQEAFIRVMRAPSAPAQGPPLRAYLFQTAINLLRDHVRRSGRIVRAGDLGDVDVLANLPDDAGRGPDARTASGRLAEKLRDLLAELPHDQRIAFEKGVLAHQSYAAIAVETGWSVSKVKVDVFRARRSLIARLRSFGFEVAAGRPMVSRAGGGRGDDVTTQDPSGR